jgi:hypothetical protein
VLSLFVDEFVVVPQRQPSIEERSIDHSVKSFEASLLDQQAITVNRDGSFALLMVAYLMDPLEVSEHGRGRYLVGQKPHGFKESAIELTSHRSN